LMMHGQTQIKFKNHMTAVQKFYLTFSLLVLL